MMKMAVVRPAPMPASAMATSGACGTCAYCARGWRNLCANIRPMGFGYDGGMAEFVVIPELAVRGGHVIKVPASLEPLHAALAAG